MGGAHLFLRQVFCAPGPSHFRWQEAALAASDRSGGKTLPEGGEVGPTSIPDTLGNSERDISGGLKRGRKHLHFQEHNQPNAKGWMVNNFKKKIRLTRGEEEFQH